jgi:hypothetical protein
VQPVTGFQVASVHSIAEFASMVMTHLGRDGAPSDQQLTWIAPVYRIHWRSATVDAMNRYVPVDVSTGMAEDEGLLQENHEPLKAQ